MCIRDRYQRAKKLSGIYRHRLLARGVPLVRGFDDYFNAPHSRYTDCLLYTSYGELKRLRNCLILVRQKLYCKGESPRRARSA